MQAPRVEADTQFTCSTGTKVQILTQKEPRVDNGRRGGEKEKVREGEGVGGHALRGGGGRGGGGASRAADAACRLLWHLVGVNRFSVYDLLYWYKSTNADAGCRLLWHLVGDNRRSVYCLLYWYKSTNADAGCRLLWHLVGDNRRSVLLLALLLYWCKSASTDAAACCGTLLV
jgi:hypothetical protein